MSSRTHRQRPLIFAHRGARCELPENTIPAFQRAVDLGADVLEMDVHLSKDGLVVVAHDHDGVRMANEHRKIRESTLREIRRWDVSRGWVGAPLSGGPYRVPTLDEVLSTFPVARLNVDLKGVGQGLVRAVVQLVANHGAERRVRLASFSEATLAALRAEGWRGETSLGMREVCRLVFLAGRVPQAFLQLHGERAQVPLRYGPVRLATKALLKRAHALGIAVDYWTVNDPTTAVELARLGADGIVTDDVRTIVRATRSVAEPTLAPGD